KLFRNKPADFHNVTGMNDGTANPRGYNLHTGLGSPVANLLVPALAGYNSAITPNPVAKGGFASGALLPTDAEVAAIANAEVTAFANAEVTAFANAEVTAAVGPLELSRGKRGASLTPGAPSTGLNDHPAVPDSTNVVASFYEFSTSAQGSTATQAL